MPRRRTRVQPFHQKYLSYPVDKQRQRLPLLNIRLRGPAGVSLTTIALVDSGATTSFIPPELAEAVGLNRIAENVDAIGAGGTFANDLYEYDVDLLKHGSSILSLRGTAHVPKEKDRIPYMVLGRDNLFLVYDITFREHQQRVVFRPATHIE